MNILFVSNDLISGGAQRVLVTLANTFSQRGHNVNILTYLDGETYAISQHIKIDSLHNIENKFRRIIAIRKKIKVFRPNVIIAFEYFVNMQVIIANWGLSSKLIISERNDPQTVGGDFPNRIIRNILYMFCDFLVCQTYDAKQYFPSYIQKHSVVIPNPVKDNLPNPWDGKREHTIVNFCRLHKQKNLPLLIDAFAEFVKNKKDYKLYIYGNGDEREYLENYIKEKGMTENVLLHEGVSDIHERILKASMFVSSSDYEGLSNSMIEAMALGLPVICTDCPIGGARMLINNNENGILVPPRDRSAMTNAMNKIIDDSQLSSKLSSNARLIRKQLSTSIIFEKWENLIKELNIYE